MSPKKRISTSFKQQNIREMFEKAKDSNNNSKGNKKREPPISFEFFEQYILNLDEIVAEVKIKSYTNSVQSRTKSNEEIKREYYQDFYFKPDIRNEYAFRLKPCPANIRNRLLQLPIEAEKAQPEACPSGDNHAGFKDTSALNKVVEKTNSKQKHKSIFPVSFDIFEKYINHEDIMKTILLRRTKGDAKKFHEMYNDDATYKHILHKYYVSFYKHPEIRKKYKYNFDLAPRDMKMLLLQDLTKADNVTEVENRLATQDSHNTIQEKNVIGMKADLCKDSTNEAISPKRNRKTSKIYEAQKKNFLEDQQKETQQKEKKSKEKCKDSSDNFQENNNLAEDALNTNKYPVTYEVFKKYVQNLHSIVLKILKTNSSTNTLHVTADDDKSYEKSRREFYEDFYLKPSIRDKYPIRLKRCAADIKEKILQIPAPLEKEDETPVMATILSPLNQNKEKAPTNVKSHGQDVYPVPFKTFCHYINHKEIVREVIRIVTQGDSEKFKVMCNNKSIYKRIMRNYYEAFYKNPKSRKKFNFQFKEASPDILKKLLSVCRTKNSVSKNVDNMHLIEQMKVGDSLLQKQSPVKQKEMTQISEKGKANTKSPIMEYERLSDVEQSDQTKSVKLPVSYNKFRNLICNYDEILTEILKEQAHGDSEKLEQLSHDAAYRDRVLRQYYRLFYMQPEIRRRYTFHIKACPTIVREQLLQIPEINTNAQDANSLEVASDSIPSVEGTDQNDNSILEKSINAREFIFPVALCTFRKYINYEGILDQIIQHHAKGDQHKFKSLRANQELCQKQFLSFYNKFYIKPKIREFYKFNFDNAPLKLKDKLLGFATPKVNCGSSTVLNVASVILEDLPAPPARSVPIKDICSPTSAPSPAMEPQNALKEISPAAVDGYISVANLPVSFETFRVLIANCDDIVREILKELTEDDTNFQILCNDEACCENILREYYHAFYVQPEIRNRYMFRVKACPLRMKQQLLEIPEQYQVAAEKQITVENAEKEQTMQETETQKQPLQPNNIRSHDGGVSAPERTQAPQRSANDHQSNNEQVAYISEQLQQQPNNKELTVKRVKKNYADYEFPVEINFFQKFVNYEEIMDQIIERQSRGDKEKYLTMRCDKKICQQQFRIFYNTFYLQPKIRNKFKVNFKPAPPQIRKKLLSFAVLKTDKFKENLKTKDNANEQCLSTENVVMESNAHPDNLNEPLRAEGGNGEQDIEVEINIVSFTPSNLDAYIAHREPDPVKQSIVRRSLTDENVQILSIAKIPKANLMRLNKDKQVLQANNIYFEKTSKCHNLQYMLRVCHGLKNRIWRAVLQMSFDEFKEFTCIFDAEDLFNYDNRLIRFYRYAIEQYNWPINLYMKMSKLQDYLNKKNVPCSELTLEHISPKLLHWCELIKYTNFDECLRFDYHKRTARLLVNESILNEERENYYSRCWEHDLWIGKIPQITDENLNCRELIDMLTTSDSEDSEQLEELSTESDSLPAVTNQTVQLCYSQEFALLYMNSAEQVVSSQKSNDEGSVIDITESETMLDKLDNVDRPNDISACRTVALPHTQLSSQLTMSTPSDIEIQLDANAATIVLPTQLPETSQDNICETSASARHEAESSVVANSAIPTLDESHNALINQEDEVIVATGSENFVDMDFLCTPSQVTIGANGLDQTQDPLNQTVLGTTDMPIDASIPKIKEESSVKFLTDLHFVLDNDSNFECKTISQKVIVIDEDDDDDFIANFGGNTQDTILPCEANESIPQDDEIALSSEAQHITTTTSFMSFPAQQETQRKDNEVSFKPPSPKRRRYPAIDNVPQLRHIFRPLPIEMCRIPRSALDKHSADGNNDQAPETSNETVGNAVGLTASQALTVDNTLFDSTELHVALDQQQPTTSNASKGKTASFRLPKNVTVRKVNKNDNLKTASSSTASYLNSKDRIVLYRELYAYDYFKSLTPMNISEYNLACNGVSLPYQQALIYTDHKCNVYGALLPTLFPHCSAVLMKDLKYVLQDLQEFHYNKANRDNPVGLRERVLCAFMRFAPMFGYFNLNYENITREWGRCQTVNMLPPNSHRRRPSCLLESVIKPSILKNMATIRKQLNRN